jgi:hypothetical protein
LSFGVGQSGAQQLVDVQHGLGGKRCPVAAPLAQTLTSSRYPRDPAHGVTVARFLRADWLPMRTRRLQPTTAHRYQQMAELYVIPRIGRVPLRRLTTGQVRAEASSSARCQWRRSRPVNGSRQW